MNCANDPTVIDYTNPLYWLDGAGAWMSRWECTGQDPVLLAVTVACGGLMFATYMVYAWRTFKSRALESKDSPGYRHAVRLTWVFVVCGTIHMGGALLAWFWLAYYLIDAFYLFNAWLTYRLNSSRLQIAAAADAMLGHQIRKLDISKMTDREVADTLSIALAEAATRRAAGHG